MNIHFTKINLHESVKKSNKSESAKAENTMHTWLSYNWHQNMYLSQNSHALSYATHTFQVSPQCQTSSKRDRDSAISFHKPTSLNFSKAYETNFLNLT